MNLPPSIYLILLALAGCAPQIEGDYREDRDPQGATAFRLAHGKYFKTNADGSLYQYPRQGQAPLPIASPYKVDGASVVVDAPARQSTLTILADGRLKLSEDGHELIYVRK